MFMHFVWVFLSYILAFRYKYIANLMFLSLQEKEKTYRKKIQNETETCTETFHSLLDVSESWKVMIYCLCSHSMSYAIL